MSCFHPHCQMYHVWAVNGELQCYQWCLFLLIGCSKRVFTAWSVRTPFNVVPSACSPTQMATSFHNPSLPWTISPPPITRIHPRKVWHDSISTSCMQAAHIPPLGQFHPSWVAQLHSLQSWIADRPGRMITLSTVFVLSVFLDPILPIRTEKDLLR